MERLQRGEPCVSRREIEDFAMGVDTAFEEFWWH